jgi:hypothetical protein
MRKVFIGFAGRRWIAALVVMAALATGSAAQARASSLTTTFAGGNGNVGIEFGLQVLPPAGVQIEGFDTNLGPGVNSLTVYTRLGAGPLDSTDGWTPRGTVPISGAVLNTPTPVPISFTLPAGSYSVVFLASGAPLAYTAPDVCQDPNFCENGGPFTEDSALRILAGSGFSGFGGLSAGPRIWNGTIYYSLPGGSPPPVSGGPTGQRDAALAKCKKKKSKKSRKRCKKRARKLPV